jgi:hypothetical protein
MLKRLFAMLLVAGLSFSVIGCGEQVESVPKDEGIEKMKQQMQQMTLPKNPQQGAPAAPGGAAPAQ